jgi:hypothetical protein
MLARVGTLTSPGSTGEQLTTVTGFGGTPKAVILWTSNLSSVTSASALQWSIGFAVSSSSQAVVAGRSRNGAVTTSTGRRQSASHCLVVLDSINSSIVLEANLVSFGSSGSDGQFTLNWSTTSAGIIVNYLVLGGDDLAASLIQLQAPASTGLVSYAHNLGQAPSAVLSLGTQWSGAPPVSATGMAATIGMWASAGNQAVTVTSNHNVGTSDTRKSFKPVLGAEHAVNTGTATRSLEVTSVDSTNVNTSWTVDSSAATYRWMLCLAGVEARIGTTVSPNGGSPPVAQDVVLSDMDPKAALFLSAIQGSTESVTDGAGMCIGATDGTNNHSIGITDEDNQETTNTRRCQQSKCLAMMDYDGTIMESATAALDDMELSLSWDAVDATQREFTYLVLGDFSESALVAGTVSFVSSGPGGISLSTTEATGGDVPYTYQWQRSTNGEDYADLDGETGLTLTDTTAENGTLYYYRVRVTDHSSAVKFSNVRTAQIYNGGALGSATGVSRLIGPSSRIG